jgi:hypothetical protein
MNSPWKQPLCGSTSKHSEKEHHGYSQSKKTY